MPRPVYQKRKCDYCGKDVTETAAGGLRPHGPRDKPCPGGDPKRPKTKYEKALRYIAEGRVKVLSLSRENGQAHVQVQGSRDEPYNVYLPQRSCDCPARDALCAHVIAGVLITDLKPSAKLYDSPLDYLFERAPQRQHVEGMVVETAP